MKYIKFIRFIVFAFVISLIGSIYGNYNLLDKQEIFSDKNIIIIFPNFLFAVFTIIVSGLAGLIAWLVINKFLESMGKKKMDDLF